MDVTKPHVRGGIVMRWLQIPIVWLRALAETCQYAERKTPQQRQRTVKLISRLGELYGWDTPASEPCKFAHEILSSVPDTRGVYRFYEGDEVTYIGVACSTLQERLSEQWNASGRASPPNKELAESIQSGRASVEWYVTPFPGWMEDYELTRYSEEHSGRLPAYNQRRGGRVGWAPY